MGEENGYAVLELEQAVYFITDQYRPAGAFIKG
jgi:hypothetical protein